VTRTMAYVPAGPRACAPTNRCRTVAAFTSPARQHASTPARQHQDWCDSLNNTKKCCGATTLLAIVSKDVVLSDRWPAESGVLILAKRKVSVTLGVDRIKQARELAGPRGLSSYINAALQEKLEREDRRQAIIEWLDELDAADPPTEEEKE
jgi:hypothetical protein